MRVARREPAAPAARMPILILTLMMALGFVASPASAQSQAPTPSPDGPGSTQPPPPREAQNPGAPALEAPRTGVEPLPADAATTTRPAAPAPAQDPAAPTPRPRGSVTVDVDVAGPGALGGPATRVYVDREPPEPIAERSSGRRPNARAVWTPGYWEWEPANARFVWVGGSWQVPPAGMAWIPGRWARDERGWYWTAGAWRRPGLVATSVNRPAWQLNGPPAEHPDDTPPPAPGPDSFYIPGHYAPTPAGDRLAWVPGFWAAMQPGWDWIPARWIRRPDGWDFREGHWMRDPSNVVIERGLGRAGRRARRNADVTVITRDPVTGAEVDVQAVGDPLAPAPIIGGMPYYVIRPPGAYPYGPNGVVVPGTVPPFVRRILNNVLP
ncbi:MAG: hypothetical protein ACYC61_30990 [Isosphaeraceae bacterium]